MSEFLTLGRNEGYEGCDDENQQELIEILKERQVNALGAGNAEHGNV